MRRRLGLVFGAVLVVLAAVNVRADGLGITQPGGHGATGRTDGMTEA